MYRVVRDKTQVICDDGDTDEAAAEAAVAGVVKVAASCAAREPLLVPPTSHGRRANDRMVSSLIFENDLAL